MDVRACEVAIVAVTTLLVIGYLLPSLVAIARGHQSWWEIVAFNLLLSWTVLGWVFALIWSLTTPRWQSTVTFSERFHGEDGAELPRQRSTRQ
jgi:hypothetical protein